MIENQATGVMKKLGLSYDDLRVVNKEIIMFPCRRSEWRGPGAGIEGTVRQLSMHLGCRTYPVSPTDLQCKLMLPMVTLVGG
ncbi:MAG: hypothetical protein CM1200mP4_1060 [Rhodospirillaceae bacterium]|nr:MAG: hypothetical protein CM1200mP4_1060 [Rhodospirillaceae bacterium]